VDMEPYTFLLDGKSRIYDNGGAHILW